MGTYVYGIVRWSADRSYTRLPAGVGDPPSHVDFIRHRSISALVSHIDEDTGVESPRNLRRDMKAHAAVLNEIVTRETVLPFRFGMILPTDQLVISRLLEPHYPRFKKLLEQLDGAVELTLRASYVEGRVLQEVVAENPRLVASGASRTKSYQARINLGQRVAQAIEQKQQLDANRVLHALKPLLRGVRVGKATNELMLLNASLLVDRKDLPEFDRILAQLQKGQADRIQFDCVGPLPPYSFVDLEL